MVETDSSVRIARLGPSDLSSYKRLRDEALRLYPDARHDLLHETNRDEVMQDLFNWLKRHLG